MHLRGREEGSWVPGLLRAAYGSCEDMLRCRYMLLPPSLLLHARASRTRSASARGSAWVPFLLLRAVPGLGVPRAAEGVPPDLGSNAGVRGQAQEEEVRHS